MPVTKNRIQLPGMTPGTSRSIAWFRYGKSGARPKVYIQARFMPTSCRERCRCSTLMPMLGEADRAGAIKGEIVIGPTVNADRQSQLVGNAHTWPLRPAEPRRSSIATGRTFPVRSPSRSEPTWGTTRRPTSRDPQGRAGRIEGDGADNGCRRCASEMMKLSIMPMIVLDLHCDQEAAFHLFVPKQRHRRRRSRSLADLGALSTMYNHPSPGALTFSGVNGALWARLGSHSPGGDPAGRRFGHRGVARPARRDAHALGQSDARNLYANSVRTGSIAGERAGPPRLKSAPTPIGGDGRRLLPAQRLHHYLVRPARK